MHLERRILVFLGLLPFSFLIFAVAWLFLAPERLYHCWDDAPPFLISYCQWDYPTLPAQAREFQAALQKAGVVAQLVFVPRESHISEMISITHDDDPTANAILQFVGSTTSGEAGSSQ